MRLVVEEIEVLDARTPKEAREKAEILTGGRVVNWRRKVQSDARHGYVVSVEVPEDNARADREPTAETTEKQRPLLTDQDIAVLNAARTILRRLAGDCQRAAIGKLVGGREVDPDAHDLGYTQAFAEAAEDAVFRTLVRARHHCKVEMTEAQLHNLQEPDLVLEGHRVETFHEVTDPFQGESPTEHDRRL